MDQIKENYYLTKKTYVREYYIKNKERILAYQKKYNQKKKEKKNFCKIIYDTQIVEF